MRDKISFRRVLAFSLLIGVPSFGSGVQGASESAKAKNKTVCDALDSDRWNHLKTEEDYEALYQSDGAWVYLAQGSSGFFSESGLASCAMDPTVSRRVSLDELVQRSDVGTTHRCVMSTGAGEAYDTLYMFIRPVCAGIYNDGTPSFLMDLKSETECSGKKSKKAKEFYEKAKIVSERKERRGGSSSLSLDHYSSTDRFYTKYRKMRLGRVDYTVIVERSPYFFSAAVCYNLDDGQWLHPAIKYMEYYLKREGEIEDLSFLWDYFEYVFDG